MEKLIDVFLNAPVYALLTLGGFIFLFVGLVGKVKDWFDLDPKSRILSGVIGPFLIITGVLLQWAGIAPKETAPPSPPKILTKHPYVLGIHPHYEMDRIIAEAQIKFDEALGKGKSWSQQWEVYETKLKFSRCLDTPVIRRVTYTRWSTWQCTIAPESAQVGLVIAWLDEIAKPIAGALPADWKILVLPQLDKSDTRFKAVDPANRIFMMVQVADTDGTGC